MADKALYVLAGYDDPTERILSGLQRSLYEQGFSGTQTRNIPMHITLGSFAADQEEAAKKALKRAAEQCAPFAVTCSHVGLFGGTDANVLFIAPDASREMLALKEFFGISAGWTAHTTLLIDRPEAIARAVPAVMRAFFPLSGTVTALYLYEFWPARLILSVPLTGPRRSAEKEGKTAFVSR